MGTKASKYRTIVGASALSLLAACGNPEPSAPIAAVPATTTPAAPTAFAGATTPATDDANASTDEDKSTSATAPVETASNYEPPFPNRIDLFVPPKRQGGAAVAKTAGEHVVELMGFIRVDRPRAVLAINGEIKPMAEGDAQFGVEVISVQPPNVVLQRGRQRWQATLD